MAAMEKNNKTLKSSIEREQKQLAGSAEHEKIKGSQNLNVPHLRFPEFSGEWEYHELQSIAPNISSGKDKPNNEGTVVLYGSTGIMGHTTTKSYNSEIVIVARVGANAGQLQLVDIPCGVTDNALVVDAKSWNKYVFFYLQHFNLNKLVFGSGQPLITGGMLKKIKIWTGNNVERNKIVHLLSLMEERIDTQKKIIEDLKKLKDAICNVNFTSGSALKLGNVGKFVRGLTYSASDVIDDTMGTVVMRSNNISNGDPVNFEELVWVNKTPNHEQILRDGDILICMANGSSPLVGKASYYVDCGMYSATVGAFCGIYRSYNPLTKWLFRSKHYKRHIQRCIQGGNGAIANIYPEDILAISFNIPSGYERVLNTLNSLEDKYLLEQKLLCRYLTVKSHLLAQLFI